MKRLSDLKNRIFISFFIIISLFFLIYFSQHFFILPLVIVSYLLFIGVCLWEFYQLGNNKNIKPYAYLSIFFSSLFSLSLFINLNNTHLSLPTIEILFLSLVVFFTYAITQFSKKNKRNTLIDLAFTCFGIFYLTLPLSSLILINYFYPNGSLWLFYLIGVTKSSDIAAYFLGSSFGKKKILPSISPKKTFFGSFCGLIASLIFSVSFTYFLPLSLYRAFFLGVALNFLGQLGDFSESLLKREANVKDSNKIPGLGGVLDITDALIFSSPMLYFYLTYTY